jgi:hypothetical protein
LLCASCDPQTSKSVSLERTNLFVPKADFEPFVLDCWEWLEFEFGPMGDLWKAYYDYAKILDPKVDLDLNTVHDSISMVRDEAEGCANYMRSDPGSKPFDPISNINCFRLAKFFSTWVFWMPKFIRIPDATFNFYVNISQTLGAGRSAGTVRGMIPTALTTRKLVSLLTKDGVGKTKQNRILETAEEKQNQLRDKAEKAKE